MINSIAYPSQDTLASKLFPRNQERADRNGAAANTGVNEQNTSVRVTLSDEALSRLEAAKNDPDLVKVSYFDKFYPVRDGFSSTNLAAAVTDPGAQPYSQDRPFEEVAASARETLDSKYQLMRESGEPYGTHQSGGLDRNSAFGEFDRRALYAIASNEGGNFSKDEQMSATNLMRQQQGHAMGFGSGPTEVAETHVNPHQGDLASSFKAMNSFLDSVSAEEKATSVEWAQQRAGGQRAYEDHTRQKGEEPEPFSSDNALLNLFLEAIDSKVDDGSSMSDHLEKYQDRINAALQENKKIFGLESEWNS